MKTYQITGMSCAACAARVEKAASSVPGVTECSVNLLTNTLSVNDDAPADGIYSAVQKAGYGMVLEAPAPTSKKTKDHPYLPDILRLIASGVISAALMVLCFRFKAFPWVQAVLSLTVILLNARFFISGAKGLIHGSPNMDTLVALGSGISYIYSLICLILKRGDMYFFDSAAMILFFISLGKLLEKIAKGRTTSALESLITLVPNTAHIKRDGLELTMDVSEVSLGELFIVRAGEAVPFDGTIQSGSGSLNEAALTGESLPVDKAFGDTISCGTLCESGYFEAVVEANGRDTSLGKMIALVEEATSTKAPIQRVADKVAAVFVPVVIGISAITLLVWLILQAPLGDAITRAVSVLVVSCPCAMGLATPVAVMVGSGVAAKLGIFFRDAASLETAGKIKSVALDKTGTLTLGIPRIQGVRPASSADALLQYACDLEYASDHPLGKAVYNYCLEKGFKPSGLAEAKAVPGGIEAITPDGLVLRSGNKTYLGSFVNIPVSDLQKAEEGESRGETPLFFARSNEYLGVILLADSLRTDTPFAIQKLRELGLDLYMLSGDRPGTARYIAKLAGIEPEHVRAALSPEQKHGEIQLLKAEKSVMMVGDGINDAPSLAQADLGCAIGTGQNVAIEAAQLILINSSLVDLADAIRLSRKVLKNIKENLFWAFFYNTLMIPLASGLFSSWLGFSLSPALSALCMSLSSLCVLLNALRLNLFKSCKEELVPLEKTIQVNGMMCSHCEAHVKKALEAIPGISEATPDHSTNTVVVRYEGVWPEAAVKSAITEEGYEYVD